MSDIALPGARSSRRVRAAPSLIMGVTPLTAILFLGVLTAGILFVAYSIYADIDATGTKIGNYLPFILLFVALMIALGFEFVNGFHDTANAVATVDLHPFAARQRRRGLVAGIWNLLRRAGLVRRRRLRHRLAAARRTDPAGRQRARALPWCSRC